MEEVTSRLTAALKWNGYLKVTVAEVLSDLIDTRKDVVALEAENAALKLKIAETAPRDVSHAAEQATMPTAAQARHSIYSSIVAALVSYLRFAIARQHSKGKLGPSWDQAGTMRCA